MGEETSKPIITGLFLCTCGGSLKPSLDFDALAEAFRGETSVHIVDFLCAEEGRREIATAVSREGLKRLVFAACTPREHIREFSQFSLEVGINPFLTQIVNLREQCAWVTADREQAGQKARSLVRAGLRRLGRQESLDKREIPCRTEVAVIGGGPAGIEAALLLSQGDHQVFLIEKGRHLGGELVTREKLFPENECAACLMQPKIRDILSNPRITVLLDTQVVGIKGFMGNFCLEVESGPRHVDHKKCIACGMCSEVCPVSSGTSRAIDYSFPGAMPHVPFIDRGRCLRFNGGDCRACSLQCPTQAIDYDRLPTRQELACGAVIVAVGARSSRIGGSVRVIDQEEAEARISGQDASWLKELKCSESLQVAFVHCYDRSELGYCSQVCCLESLKLERIFREIEPSLRAIHFIYDWCLPGKYREAGSDDGRERVVFRLKHGTSARIEDGGRRPKVVWTPESGGQPSIMLPVDLVVVLTGIRSRLDTAALAAVLGIETDQHGFLRERHCKLDPSSSSREGIYLAGMVQGPKTLEQAVVQGGQAAAHVLSRLVAGRQLELLATTAEVDKRLCSGCHICSSGCPFKAIDYQLEGGRERARVDQTLCQGCGICAAACPAGAISARAFTDEQVIAEIRGLLEAKEITEPVIAFMCNYCSYEAADNAGRSHLEINPKLLPVRVPCTGRINPEWILEALSLGAARVAVFGCHPGECHFLNGNYRSLARGKLLGSLFSQLGIEDRLVIEWIAASEGEKFHKVSFEVTAAHFSGAAARADTELHQTK